MPRDIIRAAKILLNANPTFVIRYTKKVPTNTGRLPIVSENVPQNEGAMPWTIIYTVRVVSMSDRLTSRYLKSQSLKRRFNDSQKRTFKIWPKAEK
jgi:hypothetical protein